MDDRSDEKMKVVYKFSGNAEEEFQRLEKKFPRRSSLVIWALHLVQEEEGYIPEASIPYIAERVGVSPAWISGVISFYEGFHRKPIGKYHIQVCYNVSCWMMGGDKIEECIQNKLRLQPGQSSSDGLFCYTRTQECLAGCDKAPVMLINHDYHENLTTEKVEDILDKLKKNN